MLFTTDVLTIDLGTLRCLQTLAGDELIDSGMPDLVPIEVTRGELTDLTRRAAAHPDAKKPSNRDAIVTAGHVANGTAPKDIDVQV